MSIMRDSELGDDWLREVMAKNPPRVLDSGNIFSGPVRLSFPNIFRVGRAQKSEDGTEKAGNYNAALLFPVGADLSVFERAWAEKAREAFPKNWNGDRPVGLHFPFHPQDEKAFGAKPLAGYTPGGVFLNVSSNYKPEVLDQHNRPTTDEALIYPGVWVYVALNCYAYKNIKTGVGFGLQRVRLLADDKKLGGGAAGSAESDFGAVAITATSDVASKFDAPARRPDAAPSLMPGAGHVGQRGSLTTTPVETEEQRALREMTE